MQTEQTEFPGPLSVRKKIYTLTFNDESNTGLHQSINRFIFVLIVLNLLALLLESAPVVNAQYQQWFYAFDVFSVIVFLFEYLLRVYVAPEDMEFSAHSSPRLAYVTSALGVVDLLAILPFMLELLFRNFIDLRFLRIIRMTRLLKLGRYSSASDTMFEVIKKEAPVLMASSFVMGLLVFIMAAFGYLLERDAQPDKFENIPQSIYWAVVTLASVGYGDISPVTPAGRLVTVVLVGIGIFAIPAAIMASGFTDQLRLNREQVKMALLGKLGSGPFDGPARDNLIALARDAHLTQTEINELTEQLESRGAASANASEHRQRLTLAATNPEYALAQYRTLLSKMRELVSVADTGSVSGYLEQPDEASELEKNIWQQLIARKPGGTP